MCFDHYGGCVTSAFISVGILLATLCPSMPQRPYSTPSSLLASTTATVYCTASPLSICVHFSQLSARLHASSPASASSTTSLTPCVTTYTGYQCANASNSSCVHWLASASAVRVVVLGQHVHPSVGNIQPCSSAFCRLL